MRFIKAIVPPLALLAGLGIGLNGCGSSTTAPPVDNGGGDNGAALTPAQTFATSLHGSGSGKRKWYDASNGGFEAHTNVPYDELSCGNCHKPQCENCHDDSRQDEVTQAKCLTCHGRQAAEANHYSDVHRDAGLECMDCHTKREMHGDGTVYDGMLQEGAMDAKCENAGCHGQEPLVFAHEVHGDKLDCSACHMQSVVTCYNCHFETEIQEDRKVAYGQFKDWMFLLNRGDKVYPGNMQPVKYGETSFIALAPFYAHTITKDARGCNDCHNSPALHEYEQTGAIKAVTWDTATNKLTHLNGVIPITPDYETKLKFDFVDLIGGQWQFMEEGPDHYQLRWGTPLTAAQMAKLSR